MWSALQIQFVSLFLTTASCLLQVPLYVNVREVGNYDDIDPNVTYYYDDEYYSIKDVKLGNPRKLREFSSVYFFQKRSAACSGSRNWFSIVGNRY